MVRFIFAAFALALASVSASAQDVNPLVRERIALLQQRSNPVRVQIGISMTLAGPGDASEAADKVRDDARRAIYRTALHECDILKEILAAECRLESINVNLNRQTNTNMPQGYLVHGNIGLAVVPK
jgi:hypothetical protein